LQEREGERWALTTWPIPGALPWRLRFRCAFTRSNARPSRITLQNPTAQQQVIDFDIPDSSLGSCTIAVYYDSDRMLPVPDSDRTINPNAQNCNRGAMNGDLSSIVSRDGTHVQFISGLRGTRKSAADGHLYSMSLSPLTPYYYTITVGGVAVKGQFTTGNINPGQYFPDAPLPDTTGTNIHGLQYPSIRTGQRYLSTRPRVSRFRRWFLFKMTWEDWRR